MNNHGYNVFWNEPKLDGTPQGAAERRHFVSKISAETFASRIPKEKRPRVYSASPADAHTLDERQDCINRDNTDHLNRRRLVELMGIHNITLPAKQFDKWRPTEEKTGRIDGVSDGLTCIMTDGLQGYFVREDREPLIGHVQWFKWDVPNVSYIPYYNEQGEKKFFKQETDSGAPPPYFKRPPKLANAQSREPRERKPKKPKVHVPMTSAAALDLIKRMTEGMK